VGGFPALWTEWNGKYRDTVRDFWRGEPASLGEFASRFTGSSDLYEKDNRRPIASINFVTAHDGFTLTDLVTYNEKHNAANGEDNRDGESHNRSWNHGVEGPCDDGEIHMLRERQKRNFIATLLLSQGVPMLSHGDELGRTQHGNNNAYCHDGPLTWLHWDLDPAGEAMLRFTRAVLAIRAATPALRRSAFFPSEPAGAHGLTWLGADGTPMTAAEWAHESNHSLGMLFDNGTPLLLLLNGGGRSRAFALPERPEGPWIVMIDTAHEGEREITAGLTLAPHSLVLLRQA
jgi:glycogen operon protein